MQGDDGGFFADDGACGGCLCDGAGAWGQDGEVSWVDGVYSLWWDSGEFAPEEVADGCEGCVCYGAVGVGGVADVGEGALEFEDVVAGVSEGEGCLLDTS
ncbi:hypothetical protein, partial [Rothia nasimurium]|uniref:hypothetical protein n=1 Tax=Rothia nasimurium TaxID=85336 RepID=UPI001F28D5FD